MRTIKKAVVITACALFLTTLHTVTAKAAEYKVAANDSLYKIGQLFKTPVDTIKSDNFMTSNNINIGQKLYVSAYSYKVKSGDTIYLIAHKYGITESALRQANNKWDNVIMPGQTLILPGVAPASGSTAVISYSKSDVDLLARLINAEAGGVSYKAMVAVGGVVVNRVKSTDWPNTISSVINQKIGGYYQFTPVKNGYINTPATPQSIRAAWEALDGVDPSKGAIFYFDDTSTNTWLWSKPISAQINSMVFTKA